MNHIDILNNRRKLINILIKNRGNLCNWFTNNRMWNLQDIVETSVGGSTFRAFRYLPKSPIGVYRSWALKHLSDENIIDEMETILTQYAYDTWYENLCKNFEAEWNEIMGNDNLILYGPKRKLTNLLMKRLMLWEMIDEIQRGRLIKFLHVPLDSKTLLRIKKGMFRYEYADRIGEIPNNVTMKYVANKEMYDAIQEVIRSISSEAGVPPIYIDILIWDMNL